MGRIVVFGATGNVGKYLTEYLCDRFTDFQIIAVGRQEKPWIKKTKASFVQVDITDKESFSALPTENIQAVINFAGVLPAYMEGYEPSRYIRTNTEGMLNILEYTRLCGAGRIIYAQSVSRYLGYLEEGLRVFKPEFPAKINYSNDHSVYIISKCAAVELMEHYKQAYGLSTFEIVLPNIYLYAPEMYYYVDGVRRLISYRYLINRAIEGKPLELWGNPQKGIDLVYVKDLCQLVGQAVCVDSAGGRFNVGSGKLTPLSEFFFEIVDVFSQPTKRSEIVFRPEKPDCADFLMDISSSVRELSYKPMYNCRLLLEDYKSEMQEEVIQA